MKEELRKKEEKQKKRKRNKSIKSGRVNEIKNL